MVRPDSNSTIDTIFFADLDQLNLFVKEFTYREDPTLFDNVQVGKPEIDHSNYEPLNYFGSIWSIGTKMKWDR